MTPSFPTRRSADLFELQYRRRIGSVDLGIGDEQFGAESLVALRAVGTQVLLAEAVGFQLRGSGARPAFRNVVAGRDGAAERQHFTVVRSEEHTSELQSLMRISYAVFCLKKK